MTNMEPVNGPPRETSAVCRNGHKRTDANTYHRNDGAIKCRDCDREQDENKRRKNGAKSRPTPAIRRRSSYDPDALVVAVDTEGITHIEGEAQSSVIFGTSVTKPLIAYSLSTQDKLYHLREVYKMVGPNCVWVWFGSNYDIDQLLQHLHESQLRKFIGPTHTTGEFRFDSEPLISWKLSGHRGKWLDVTWWDVGEVNDFRGHTNRGRTNNPNVGGHIRIFDYASFFGKGFLGVAEEILRDELTDEDKSVIALGKQKRGENKWEDLKEIHRYWTLEIQLIKRVFEKFRSILVGQGFPLKQWYGPGAMAQFIFEKYDLTRHMHGAQTHIWNTEVSIRNPVMPDEVHAASKIAFAGGRFELFKCGRIEGPVYLADINSGYPAAYPLVPSLAEGTGEWVHVENPTEIEPFGVYRIRYEDTKADSGYAPQPLFFRNSHGGVSWPDTVHGWYWSPEAYLALGRPGVNVLEGWVWRTHKEPTYPFALFRDFYDMRMRIGKDDLRSLPFKLGMNSAYGKNAQTVGWDYRLKTPPRFHALPIAGFITSFTRAKVWAAIANDPNVIAVETDSIMTTTPPDQLFMTIGSGLGEWSVKQYDEVIYVQSGMYYARRGDKWDVSRTRGLGKTEIPVELVMEWLDGLGANDNGSWEPLTIVTQPRYIGLPYALHTATEERPYYHTWRRWETQTREITIGNTGKRTHQSDCEECSAGNPIGKTAHPLSIDFRELAEARAYMSHERAMPWEKEYTEDVLKMRAADDRDKELYR